MKRERLLALSSCLLILMMPLAFLTWQSSFSQAIEEIFEQDTLFAYLPLILLPLPYFLSRGYAVCGAALASILCLGVLAFSVVFEAYTISSDAMGRGMAIAFAWIYYALCGYGTALVSLLLLLIPRIRQFLRRSVSYAFVGGFAFSALNFFVLSCIIRLAF